MKRKIYARTINPEYFDYRIYEDEVKSNENIIIDGGRQFCGFNNEVLGTIQSLYEDYHSWDYERCLKVYYDNSITAYFKDMLHLKELSRFQAGRIRKALDSDNLNEIRLTCLSIIKGKPYGKFALRGNCQGDLVYLYAPTDTDHNYIGFIEAWYFGTGTEVEIDDSGRSEVKSPEDIEGYTFYTATWDLGELKKEIIQQSMLHDETEEDIEVVLWLYDHTETIKIDKYKQA